MKPTLKFLSFGAGAIGTYIGGSLALQGHEVVFLERPEVAEDLRQRGLRLDLTANPKCKMQEAARLSPSSVVFASSLEDAFAYGPFDAAIFALKSYDTDAALENIRPIAEKMPPVLCLQNGVENEARLAEVLGAEKVLYGTVTSAVGRRAAGDIVLKKLRGVGIAQGHPLSETLVRVMNDACLNARLYPVSADMKWSKMLTNLLANASAAILDMSPAEILADPKLYDLEMRALLETLRVMKASGIRVVNLPGTPVRALAALAKGPRWLRPLALKSLSSGRGGKMPSFHLDLHSGRGKSEVDFLNGAVVRAGERAGIPTPVNRLLNETLLALTRGDLPLDAYAHKPEKLLEEAGWKV